MNLFALTTVILASGSIELPEDVCLVDTVKVADCTPLAYNYAIGDTQVVYWKDCYGFTYSQDYLPDDSWDYMVICDNVVENSGKFYTEFEFCGPCDYAYFYKECPPEESLPEPSSAFVWGALFLLCLRRRR